MNWRRKDEELKAELDAHVAMDVEARIARGVLPDEAAAAARRELGNVGQIAEAARDAWGGRWIDHVVQDVRYALRVFRRNPGYAAVAVLSVALGIGANTALFEVVDAVRLQPLPVTAPEGLADVHIADMTGVRGNRQSWNPAITQPVWRELVARQTGFAALFAWGRHTFDLAGGGEVRPVEGIWITGEYFSTLGLQPAIGRLLVPADDAPGCTARAVLGYRFWQRAYGGDRSIVGTTITLDSRAAEIVGVSPSGFAGLEVGRSFDVALPLCTEPSFSVDGKGRRDAGTTWWLTVFGRLKPGWTIERASAQLATVSPTIFAASLPRDYPPASIERYRSLTLAAYPGTLGLSHVRENYGKALWLLLATAGLVLVIACVNLANLLLARATARQREFAMRLSLGASRGRVVRQLLTESLILAAIGATGAVFMAGWLGRMLVAFLGEADTLLTLDVAADWRVLAFAAALALLTVVLFGVAPALKSTRVATAAVLRQAGRGLTAGRDALALRRLLVIAQLALAGALLFGSLLFARTLIALTRVDPGFNPRGVIAVDVDAQRLALPADRLRPFRRDLLERVRAVRGVENAASVGIVPLSGDASSNDVWPAADRRAAFNTLLNAVSRDYFRTLGIRLVAGRDFDDRDTPSSPGVAIVSETFVKSLPAGAQVLGSTIVREATPATPERSYQLIGIVADSKYLSLRDEPRPVMFLADSQDGAAPEVDLLVRATLPPAALTAALTNAVRQIDPRLAVSYTILSDQIRDGLMTERLLALLSGGFGALAALLTLVGLYGLIAYTVTRRTNEIGVRIALGATRRDIAALLVKEIGVPLAFGVAVGVALAIAGGRAAATLLYAVKPDDPVTLSGAVAALILIAAIATLLPARRATRIEPVAALRVE